MEEIVWIKINNTVLLTMAMQRNGFGDTEDSQF